MNPDFTLQHFRFHLEPREPARLPAYNKGNVIRGAFGSTFKRIVCHAACQDAETCELREVCPYVAVFHPFVPHDSPRLSRNRDLPRPFVIKPPLETREVYSPGEALSFDLVVVGRCRDYLPYFVVTFRELSEVGLGHPRARCELAGIQAVSPSGELSPVFESRDSMVRPPTRNILWSDLTLPDETLRHVRRVKLRFLTPTTIKAEGTLVRRPSFADIAKRLRDRINALSYFFCGKELTIDFKAFGEAAERVRTVEDATRWIDTARYSRRREVAHDLSGFVGDVVFEGDLGSFFAYLKLGEYVHVGKNAVFGNGWYRIEQFD